MAAAGRPSLYSEALVAKILEQIAGGQSLRRICRKKGMPDRTTVTRWLDEHSDFAAKYARARDLQADWLEEDMDDVERAMLKGKVEPAVGRAVLESKRWRASKLAPKRFGNRVAMEVEGRLTLEQLVAGTGAQPAAEPEPDEAAGS